MNTEPEVHINPFTGEQFTRNLTDGVIDTIPPQSSFYSRSRQGGPVGKTGWACLNQHPKGVSESLQDLAKGLSEMTGYSISFRLADSEAIHGDFGFFLVKDPKLVVAPS